MDDTAHILLVDDRPQNLLALEAILQEVGGTPIRATSGREALRQILEQEFAVILLDVQMPEMDGLETAEVIRSRDDTRHTPIIFVTAADDSNGATARAYALGAVDFIYKPIEPATLRAKVSVFLELYRKTREVRRLNEELEHRVQERTRELEQANGALQREIAERRQVEAEVRALNTLLEERVRRRTAELEAANRELRSFSYSVSHDLRAPLRKIDTLSQLLQEEQADRLDADGRDCLARIRAASRHMSELIEDMLHLSMATQSELNYEAVNLSRLAGEILDELKQSSPERRIESRIDAGMAVEGDARLLRLALYNLLENAWKYTSRQPHTCIEVGMTGQDEERVFYVRDNGTGFDMQRAERLFAPFQRLHAPVEYPGTGIGLAIVRRVVERHGGKTWAESTPGQGATFYFSL